MSRNNRKRRVASAQQRGRGRSWALLTLLVVALIGAGIAYIYFSGEGDRLPGGATSSPTSREDARGEGLPFDGTASVSVELDARMPEDFDDGVLRRNIRGQGVIDLGTDVASVAYDVSDAPNSAGYFGHVEGDMKVVYEESHFLTTFRILARVLDGPLRWMRYEFSDLADPHAIELGIGQLRELGLSDPRLGLALAATVEQDLAPGRVLHIDTQTAAGRVPLEYVPIVGELRRLAIDTVELEVDAVEDGIPTSFSYRLEYPPAVGSENVRLDVSVELTDLGTGEQVKVPPPERVRSFAEHVSI